MVYTTPSHVGHVKQAVYAAKIHKRTVFSDVFHNTVNTVAFSQFADNFSALFSTRLFQDCTTGDNDVATTTVHFQDLERLLQAHQWAGVTHRAHVNLAAWQEGHGAAEINCKAAFNPAEDSAINALFIGIGFFQTIPGFFTTGHFTADNSLAFGVFCCTQKNFNNVAH